MHLLVARQSVTRLGSNYLTAENISSGPSAPYPTPGATTATHPAPVSHVTHSPSLTRSP
ncbi:MAG: hypothetical protein ACREF3_04455 [Acetobacteraceae bacterium]